MWATPLPAGLDVLKAGPLLCAGITVFNPLVQFDVRPTQRVGVIGIGGLGHLALKMLNKWGCEVTAFTSTDAKRDAATQMGAHHVVNSRHASQLSRCAPGRAKRWRVVRGHRASRGVEPWWAGRCLAGPQGGRGLRSRTNAPCPKAQGRLGCPVAHY